MPAEMRRFLFLITFSISLEASAELFLATRQNFATITVGQPSELNSVAIVARNDEIFPDIQSIEWTISFDDTAHSIDVVDIYGAGSFTINNGTLIINQTQVVSEIDTDSLELGIIPYLLFDFEVVALEVGEINIVVGSAIGVDSSGSMIDLLADFGANSDLVSDGVTYSVVPSQFPPKATVNTIPLEGSILLAITACTLLLPGVRSFSKPIA